MLTPRNYLSYSSLHLLETDEKEWIQKYLYGKERRINQGQAYGKQLSEGLENGELTGDPALDLVATMIPAFECRDLPITLEMKDGKEKIPIMIKMDTFKKDLSAFKEYKTGQILNPKSADDQITFYATGCFLKTGKIPKDIEWVGIQTKMQLDGKLRATGDIIRRPVTRNMTDCLKMMLRIKKAWARIKILTAQEWL